MRKLLFLLMAVVAAVASSCSGDKQDNYDAIYEKIQNGDELSQEDYGGMIEYVRTASLESLEMLKEADQSDYESLQEIAGEINRKYPYLEVFDSCMARNYDMMDADNKEALRKVQSTILEMLE